jgi:phosphoribosylaminoimidazole-succinocarboxamide synthase
VAQGTRFEHLLPEFYYKDDAQHDPRIVYDSLSQTWDMYVASKPIVEGFLHELPAVVTRGGRTVSAEDVQKLGNLAIAVFCILEVALYELEIVLWDMKIECGYDSATGQILVADDITNDSWRIRFRDEQEFKDKQVYRDLAKVTDGDLEKLADNYAWVAEKTSHFAFKHPIRMD